MRDAPPKRTARTPLRRPQIVIKAMWTRRDYTLAAHRRGRRRSAEARPPATAGQVPAIAVRERHRRGLARADQRAAWPGPIFSPDATAEETRRAGGARINRDDSACRSASPAPSSAALTHGAIAQTASRPTRWRFTYARARGRFYPFRTGGPRRSGHCRTASCESNGDQRLSARPHAGEAGRLGGRPQMTYGGDCSTSSSRTASTRRSARPAPPTSTPASWPSRS